MTRAGYVVLLWMVTVGVALPADAAAQQRPRAAAPQQPQQQPFSVRGFGDIGITWFSAADAKENGFIDSVTPNVTATANFEMENLPDNIKALFKPKEEPVVAKTPLALDIEAAAKVAGFEALAGHFALNYASLADARAAFAVAGEIKGLCAVAKKPDLLTEYVTAKLSVSDVRAKLVEVVAAEAGADVDNHQPEQKPNDQKPTAGKVTTASIWAARNKQLNLNQKGA